MGRLVLAKPQTNLKQKTTQKNNLKIVDKSAVLTKPYNDIDLNKWKEYPHILTDSLWEFSSRERSGGHSYDYHGNYIPQIAHQLYERFTQNHKTKKRVMMKNLERK